MEERIRQLEQEIENIKERNHRVQSDKAWETSRIKLITILVITYLIAAFALWIIGGENVLLGAIIPTLGYYLSNLSLPFIKSWWIKKFYK
ncbi:MAG TPA: hypothetical protein VGE63_00225 [Candidatus Paceibacterota bacterium]